MKRARVAEGQIIAVLKQHEAGAKPPTWCASTGSRKRCPSWRNITCSARQPDWRCSAGSSRKKGRNLDVQGSSESIVDRLAFGPDHPARPPLVHLVGGHRMSGGFPIGDGRHHSFPRRSFKAALSSMASASNRFSREFSDRAFSAAWPPRRPSRQTSPSICRCWRR